MLHEDPSACEQARAAPALCPGDTFREANPRAAAEQGAGAVMCAELWLPSAVQLNPARSPCGDLLTIMGAVSSWPPLGMLLGIFAKPVCKSGAEDLVLCAAEIRTGRSRSS